MITIGIDPAFRKDGFAIAILATDKTVRFKIFKSFLFFIRWATDPGEVPDPKNVLVGIENSNMQDVTFNPRASSKENRNVGANQAASQYTVDFCRWWFGEKMVFQISPRQKGRKWSDQVFRQVVRQEGHTLYGYKGYKNEQDKRDAYQIALQARKRASFRAAKIKI